MARSALKSFVRAMNQMERASRQAARREERELRIIFKNENGSEKNG